MFFFNRCFQCSKSDCPLALKNPASGVDIVSCYETNCRGIMRLKKNSRGWSLVCTNNGNGLNQSTHASGGGRGNGSSGSGCKGSWFLPKPVQSIQPTDRFCQPCYEKYHRKLLLLTLTVIRGPPGTEGERTVCAHCDVSFWDQLGIRPLKMTGATAKSGGTINGTLVTTTTSISSGNVSRPISMSHDNRLNSTTISTPYAPSNNQQYPLSTTTIGSYTPSTGSFPRSTSYEPFHSYNNNKNSNNNNNFNSSNTPSGNYVQNQVDNTNYPKCTCGNITKLLTTRKAGENNGRQFYSCSKDR
jgi:hypothetical protein